MKGETVNVVTPFYPNEWSKKAWDKYNTDERQERRLKQESSRRVSSGGVASMRMPAPPPTQPT